MEARFSSLIAFCLVATWPRRISSLADEFQRLAFFEGKWLGFQRCNSGGNVFGIHAAGHGRLRFERWKFVLRLLPMFGANLDEGVNRADGHVEADALVKNANDVAIRAASAATGESVRGGFRAWSEVVSPGSNPAGKEGSGP
jgi:hypothetical protein